MNRNAKGLGFYLIVVLLILLLLTYFRGGLEASQSWNYDQLKKAITQEEVVKVEITPNQEVPTGSLKVLLSDGNVKYVNVTDITKAESELREHESIDVEIEDVERSSVWISILPSLLIGVVLVFVFTMMNRQAGGRQQQDDEFWQEPCTHDYAGCKACDLRRRSRAAGGERGA